MCYRVLGLEFGLSLIVSIADLPARSVEEAHSWWRPLPLRLCVTTRQRKYVLASTEPPKERLVDYQIFNELNWRDQVVVSAPG